MADKPTIYLETTIPSFLTARPSGDLIAAGEQETTRKWWETRRGDFNLFVSDLVLAEAARGDASAAQRRLETLKDLPLLAADDEVDALTQAILKSGVIPAKAATDAAHVAIAARHGMDVLMTWNCKHIANAELLFRMAEVVARAGYRLPVICTPRELMGGLDHDA
ncbi:MAG TPA: type II toxin-antitoxin system VapC family toxin [Kiritimatiellia bacterium]|nr:type II toxin-antitoxin system VapC family toxin [Kiritimatiellia bacterium]